MPPKFDLMPPRALPPKKPDSYRKVADSISETLLNSGRAQRVGATPEEKRKVAREVEEKVLAYHRKKKQLALERAQAVEKQPVITPKEPLLLLAKPEAIVPAVLKEKPVVDVEDLEGNENNTEVFEKEARIAWLRARQALQEVEMIDANGISLEFFGTLPPRYQGTEDGLLPQNPAAFMTAVHETGDPGKISRAQDFFKALHAYLQTLDRLAEVKGGVAESRVAERYQPFAEGEVPEKGGESLSFVEAEREQKLSKVWEAVVSGLMDVIDIGRREGIEIKTIGRLPSRYEGTDQGLYIQNIRDVAGELQRRGKQDDLNALMEYAQALNHFEYLLVGGIDEVPAVPSDPELALRETDIIDETPAYVPPTKLLEEKKVVPPVERPVSRESAEGLFERVLALRSEVARVTFATKDKGPQKRVEFSGVLPATLNREDPTGGFELKDKQEVLKHLRRTGKGYELDIVQKYLVLVARLDIACAREEERKEYELPAAETLKRGVPQKKTLKPMKGEVLAETTSVVKELATKRASRERLMSIDELLTKSEFSAPTKQLIKDARIPFYLNYTDLRGDIPKALKNTVNFLKKKIQQVKKEQGMKRFMLGMFNANSRLKGYETALGECNEWLEALDEEAPDDDSDVETAQRSLNMSRLRSGAKGALLVGGIAALGAMAGKKAADAWNVEPVDSLKPTADHVTPADQVVDEGDIDDGDAFPDAPVAFMGEDGRKQDIDWAAAPKPLPDFERLQVPKTHKQQVKKQESAPEKPANVYPAYEQRSQTEVWKTIPSEVRKMVVDFMELKKWQGESVPRATGIGINEALSIAQQNVERRGFKGEREIRAYYETLVKVDENFEVVYKPEGLAGF